MNVRNQAIAMSAQAQNVANAVLQQILPLFLANEDFYAMYMFGNINVVLLAYVWFFIPETKGIPLEEIDVLFGGAAHTDAHIGTKQEDITIELAEHVNTCHQSQK